MKKYVSVFALSARHTLPRLLIILIAASAAQIVLFYTTLCGGGKTYTADTMPLLQDVIQRSHILWILGGAFLLYMAVLCGVFEKKASGLTAYTICRLPVSEPAFYWIQTLYNWCVLLLFLGAEIAAILVMTSVYDGQIQLSGASRHLTFLGFYQSSVLHSLLPLADVQTHVENLLICLSLGLCAARFAKKQSRGLTDMAAPLAVIITVLAFCDRSGFNGMLHVFLSFVIVAGAVSAYTISKGGTLDEEDINADLPPGAGEKLPAEN